MSAPKTDAEPMEIDLVAPWSATGKLSRDDAAALDRMLADDPDLAARLDFAEEERAETVALNEALPTPSRASLDRLFQRIEAHEAANAPMTAGLMNRLSSWIAALSPRTMGLAAGAAALVIALQAGLLTQAYFGGSSGTAYETASDGSTPAGVTGTVALVAFQPKAGAGDVAKLLAETKTEIVGGPKPGGVFLVRLSQKALSPQETDAALMRFRDAKALVRFASPSGAQ